MTGFEVVGVFENAFRPPKEARVGLRYLRKWVLGSAKIKMTGRVVDYSELIVSNCSGKRCVNQALSPWPPQNTLAVEELRATDFSFNLLFERSSAFCLNSPTGSHHENV
jgi:hypothetical protein